MMQWIEQEMAGVLSKSLKRELRWIETSDAAKVVIGGQTYLNFSSNNYLGLARHPDVLEAVRQVTEHWGAGATASRLISGSTIIHEDLERALAAFLKKEAALLFPSGYMANLGVVTTLVGEGDAIIADRLSHASLIDAARLSGARLFIYEHRDTASAKKALERAKSYRRRLLMTDGLFSMDGDFAPMEALSDLCRHYDAMGLVDDAHALGVWGSSGRGVVDQNLNFDWILVGTLSKALGSQGGFICGSRALIDLLVNRARSFIFTTGLSPLCVAAAQAALSLVQNDPAPRVRVQDLSKRLREGLVARGWNILGSESQIVPILLGSAENALEKATELQEAGVYAPAIRPPTVHAKECRIRFSVTAEHTEQDIDALLTALPGSDPKLKRRASKGTEDV